MQAQRFPPRRAATTEPCDVLVYGVPDSSPYAIWAAVNPILTLISMGLGYLGGMIEAAGKPGVTVVMAAAARESWDRVHHPSYPEVWERVLPLTRDPYEITVTRSRRRSPGTPSTSTPTATASPSTRSTASSPRIRSSGCGTSGG